VWSLKRTRAWIERARAATSLARTVGPKWRWQDVVKVTIGQIKETTCLTERFVLQTSIAQNRLLERDSER
jgi:hypothetical protein